MSDKPLREKVIQEINDEMARYEARANKNKKMSDTAGAIVIILGALSGLLIAIPDSTLKQMGIELARPIIPVLTATVYAAIRYYRWGDKHLWYWFQRHRLKGLLVRENAGAIELTELAREFDAILLTAEANYPLPVYAIPEKKQNNTNNEYNQ